MQGWRGRAIDDTIPGSVLTRYPWPVRQGRQTPTYRIDTYDIWAQGKPIHTGIPEYRMATESAHGYSGALPLSMIYIFYSGIYGKGKNRPRPLAAFLAGKQQPLPIRLTPSDDIDRVAPAYPPLEHRHSLRVVRWGGRAFAYRDSIHGSWNGEAADDFLKGLG